MKLRPIILALLVLSLLFISACGKNKATGNPMVK